MLDCEPDDARQGSTAAVKAREEAEISSCRQARNEESWYRRLKEVVGSHAALDAVNKVPNFQKIDTLHVHLVTGRIQDVIDLDGSPVSRRMRSAPPRCSELTTRVSGRIVIAS